MAAPAPLTITAVVPAGTDPARAARWLAALRACYGRGVTITVVDLGEARA